MTREPMKNPKQCTLLPFLDVMEALRKCKAKGLAGTHCHTALVITVFSHQEVRESVYRAGKGYRVQPKGVVLQERDNFVGICVDVAESLMTCQAKLPVTACAGCLVVAGSGASQRFRSSGYDEIAQAAQHRPKFCATLFLI